MKAEICRRCSSNPVHPDLVSYGVCKECWNETVEAVEGRLDKGTAYERMRGKPWMNSKLQRKR
jgi:hypothetical protein